MTGEATNTLAGIQASNASVLQVLSASSFGFNDPDGVVFDGSRVWGANARGNSVTPVPVG